MKSLRHMPSKATLHNHGRPAKPSKQQLFPATLRWKRAAERFNHPPASVTLMPTFDNKTNHRTNTLIPKHVNAYPNVTSCSCSTMIYDGCSPGASAALPQPQFSRNNWQSICLYKVSTTHAFCANCSGRIAFISWSTVFPPIRFFHVPGFRTGEYFFQTHGPMNTGSFRPLLASAFEMCALQNNLMVLW